MSESLVIQITPGVNPALGRALRDVVAEVRFEELPARSGVCGLVAPAVDLRAAGPHPASVGILGLIRSLDEAAACAAIGAMSALATAPVETLVEAAVAAAERRTVLRSGRPAYSDDLVDTLHAQLRSLTERRQGWEHEVRTPLGIIRSNAANLRDGIDGPITADQGDSIESILDAATQLERLLDRDQIPRPNTPPIVLPSEMRNQRRRTRVGEGGIGRTLVHIVPLVRRVVAQFTASAERQGVALRLSAASDLPMIWVDEVKIIQLVSNLVSNALKHGGDARSIQVRVAEESVTGAAEMYGIRLTVRDSGAGIREDLIERIFERGVRGYGDQPAPPGLGLGLTVSRDLVASHGGRLWAENLPEGGAAFHAILPVDLRSLHLRG